MKVEDTCLVALMALAGVAGCSDPAEGVCDAEWNAPEWEDNTVEALALRSQLDELAGTMREAEQGAATVDSEDTLVALFEAGDPSVADIVSPNFEGIVDNAFDEFVDLIGAGDVDLVDDSGEFEPGPAGGLFGEDARGINEGGLEVRQIIDKGLFAGSGHFTYAMSLTEGTITTARIDSIAAAWGANADFNPEDEEDAITDSANYANSMGYFDQMEDALAIARAAAAGDSDCTGELNEALRTFFSLWEESMIARFVHYTNVALEAAEGGGDEDYAGAIHELSEGLGLAIGFLGADPPASGPLSSGVRTLTDGQVETLLETLGVDTGDLGGSTTGAIVVDSDAFGVAVEEVNELVVDAYDLSDDELEAWITGVEEE